MPRISYAVIALKRDEVDPIIADLRARKMRGIADWLNNRKDDLYGERIEDWKPFGGKPVTELLNQDDDNQSYSSETHLIDALDENLSNTKILFRSGIELFIVDVFALFCERYKRLADKMDLMLAEANRKCCLVMPYGLSTDGTSTLITYSEVWSSVSEAYLHGSLHPIVLRADDLKHLRNYLLTLPRLDDGPDEEKGRAVDKLYGQGLKPRLG